MKSFIIATVLALAGFASLTAAASADHYSNNNYRGSQAGCNTGYGGGFGQWSQGPVRQQLNLYPQSRWNGGQDHGHGHNHNHGQVQRRNNNGGLYFGNRDFSLGIRF